MRKTKNQSGAFLLEALLAVFILSVALVGLIRGLLSSMNGIVAAEKYYEAILAADNVLLDVVGLSGQKIVAPVLLTDTDHDIKVRITAKYPESLSGDETLQQAHLSVQWPGKLKDKSIEATTFIFGLIDEKKN